MGSRRPKIRLRKDGIWLGGPGNSRMYRWRVFLLFLIVPILFFLSLVLAMDRSFPIIGYLATVKTAEQRDFLWETFVRTNRVALDHVSRQPPPLTGSIPTAHLITEDDALVRMIRARKTGDPTLGHTPEGDRPYFPAVFIEGDGKPQKAKFSSRGFSLQHMDPEKPSLRVKIKKADATDGFRFVELSRPEDSVDLLNWLPEEFARRLGLLTSHRDHVRLFINRRYKGLYIRSHRPGEPLGLLHGKLPGTWFKGDLMNSKGGYSTLWDTIDAWRLYGQQDENSLAFFKRFLALVATPPQTTTQDLLDQFWSFMDFETSAGVAAIATLVGSTHTDETHNHLYFLSPYHGRLEPVTWDTNAYDFLPANGPVDYIKNRLGLYTFADPRWVHRRNLILWELLSGPAAQPSIQALVANLLARVGPDLEADPALGRLDFTLLGQLFLPLSAADVETTIATRLDWMKARDQLLRQYLDNAAVAVTPDGNTVKVTVLGTVAVSAVSASQTALLYPGLSSQVKDFRFSLNGTPANVLGLLPAPATYTLPAGSYEFTNAVTGGQVFTVKAAPPAQPLLTVMPPLAEEPSPVTLGPGRVKLERTLRTAPGQPLKVLAGTQLELGPQVSIVAQGPVSMEGTRTSPISIRGRQWGCLAIRGPLTDGSRLAFVSVEGGSEVYDNGTHFRGMVSIYECPSVRLSGCRFGPNLAGDDAVNIAHSQVTVADCHWEQALFDGLDLDACDAVVRDCTFTACGNDGLDLMACRLRVTDSRFERCGDKGVSVGESTRLLAQNLLVTGCEKGIESKDDSQALIERSTFRSNTVALHAYKKKWLYQRGGSTVAIECVFEDNGKQDEFDTHSDVSYSSTPEYDQLKANLETWSSEGFPAGGRNLLR